MIRDQIRDAGLLTEKAAGTYMMRLHFLKI